MELDAELWLRQQNSLIHDLFDRSATDLRDIGIHLLLGSAPPVFEDLERGKRITILPLRFASSSGGESLSLSLLATISGGPARYVVILAVSGSSTVQALRNLILEHEDVWEKAYLRIGLWIGEGVNARLLNNVSQIRDGDDKKFRITGVFLHSDLIRTIQGGVMLVGLLYRSILDELSDAGKMRRLYAQLTNYLDDATPGFRRIIRP